MNRRQQAATAIMAIRANNPPVYCWVESGWLDGGSLTEAEQIADMQRENPLNEIISICWGHKEATVIRTM